MGFGQALTEGFWGEGDISTAGMPQPEKSGTIAYSH
jgi:hypothetical protein